jgi:nucleoid-associated protein YgaU
LERSRVTHWGAPIAFLAAITIGALVVRAGFQRGSHHHAQPPTITVASKKGHGHGQTLPRSRTYTVVSGDTLAGIAAKTGTTVARLEQLNPGVDPKALRVGQTIRVQ